MTTLTRFYIYDSDINKFATTTTIATTAATAANTITTTTLQNKFDCH